MVENNHTSEWEKHVVELQCADCGKSRLSFVSFNTAVYSNGLSSEATLYQMRSQVRGQSESKKCTSCGGEMEIINWQQLRTDLDKRNR